jgi:hypothetical protein
MAVVLGFARSIFAESVPLEKWIANTVPFAERPGMTDNILQLQPLMEDGR